MKFYANSDKEICLFIYIQIAQGFKFKKKRNKSHVMTFDAQDFKPGVCYTLIPISHKNHKMYSALHYWYCYVFKWGSRRIENWTIFFLSCKLLSSEGENVTSRMIIKSNDPKLPDFKLVFIQDRGSKGTNDMLLKHHVYNFFFKFHLWMKSMQRSSIKMTITS